MKSLATTIQSIQNVNILRPLFPENGNFPNNGLLPLLIYKGAVHVGEDETDMVKEILESNGWTNAWVDGVYDYHHYHSTAHEVLVVVKGTARVQFGGPNGTTFALENGDVIIIPAGVAHKKVEDADGFTCVGAYPLGQQYDMNYGKKGERPRVDEDIRKVPLPEIDPVYGAGGPLSKNWFSQMNEPSTL